MEDQSLEALQKEFLKYLGRELTQKELESKKDLFLGQLENFKMIYRWQSKLDLVEPATVSSLLLPDRVANE